MFHKPFATRAATSRSMPGTTDGYGLGGGEVTPVGADRRAAQVGLTVTTCKTVRTGVARLCGSGVNHG